MTSPLSYLRASNVYFLLATLTFAGAVAYGILQYRIFEGESAAIVKNAAELATLTETVEKSSAAFKIFAEERAKKQAELAKKLRNILPPDENYTDLTRQLDQYFIEHDKVGNPIFQSSLRFGKGAPAAGLSGVSTLSMSMNLEATRDNFYKFLDFVHNSGSLETGTRLMDINSVQLNFSEGGEVVKNPKQEINFTVDMNAYYQTPRVAR